MYFLRDGIYRFDGRKIKEAHQWCLEQCKENLKLGNNVVVANTFTTIMELRPYLFAGHKTIVYKMCNVFTSIHNVPEATMQKMKDRWENCFGEIEIRS